MSNHSRSTHEPTKEGRSSAQWLLLQRWVEEHGWRRGAEIGLQRGWTICHLLSHCPDLHMIGVDQWIEVPDTGEAGWQSYDHIDLDHWASVVKRRVESFRGRGIVYHMSSIEAATKVPEASLDFVFIDADHTERGKREDLRAWVPKVTHSGWVTGHDWNRPEVRRVLDEMLPGWRAHTHFCWSIPRAEIAWC